MSAAIVIFGPFLHDPVSGVLLNDNSHVRSDQLHLLLNHALHGVIVRELVHVAAAVLDHILLEARKLQRVISKNGLVVLSCSP